MAIEETTRGTKGPDTFAPIALPTDRESVYEAPKSSGGVLAGAGAALATLSVIGLFAFAKPGTEPQTTTPTAPIAAAAMPAKVAQPAQAVPVVVPAPTTVAREASAAPTPAKVTTAVATAVTPRIKHSTTSAPKLVAVSAPKSAGFDPTADLAPGLDLSVGVDRPASVPRSKKLIMQASATQKAQAFLGIQKNVLACVSGLDSEQHNTVSVVLQIEGETGSVRSVRAGGVTSPAVLSCVERAAYRAKFPVFAAETDTASHNYQF